MLQQPFYFQLTRKYITLFGSLFKNITIIREEDNGGELKRFKVPLDFGPKEKMIMRIEQDLDLQKATAITLPRMSFELVNRQYDPNRKQNSLLKVAKGDTLSRVASQYMPVPYDFNFQLNIYARNIDDCYQIVEQILPTFNPDYTPTVTLIEAMGFKKDIPIVLDDHSEQIIYEGDWNSTRFVYYTMNFKLKGYLYGPITSPKIIRKVITNIYNDPSLRAGNVVRVTLNEEGSGDFWEKDIVYQGPSQEKATAYAIVRSWDRDTRHLDMGGAQGTFKLGETIRASSSNAVYRIEAFDATPLKLAMIEITPDPEDAEPDDDYGFNTNITEYY